MSNWSAEQMANARLIVAIGTEMGMSSRDITIGLMTAMQESSLMNLSGGDRDSAGLFQQRPGQGWGSYSQVTNPLYSTRKFFTALQGVKGRNSMTTWAAAQAVQRSAFPMAFAKWEGDAQRLLGQTGVKSQLPFPLKVPAMPLQMDGYLAGQDTSGVKGATGATTTTTPGVAATTSDKASPSAPGAGAITEQIATPTQPAPDVNPADLTKALGSMPGVQGAVTGARGKVVDAAMRWLGTPYLWGGGNANGPTFGSAHGFTGTGFDCSGLVLYAMAQAGLKMPRIASQQLSTGSRVPLGQLQPGDLVGMENGGHIGIYIGNGRMIEAPHTGAKVRISTLKGRSDAWGVHLNLSGGGSMGSAPDLSALSAQIPAAPATAPAPTGALAFPGL